MYQERHSENCTYIYAVAAKIIRPSELKIFFDLYLLDKESYEALVFSILQSMLPSLNKFSFNS